MPHTISIDVDFCAGHRLLGHTGRCRWLHGHNYTATITLTEVDGLDGLGMVVDFGVVKKIVKGWIDENWDHNVVLNDRDPLFLLDDGPVFNLKDNLFAGRMPYMMDRNPTAENMAAHLYAVLNGPLGGRIVSVTVRETPNCSATFTA